MLDALRDTDWSPRSLRRKRRDIEAARRRVEIDTCSAPRPRAVAVALGVTLDTYYGIIRDASLSQLLSLDELASTSGTNIGPIDENPLPDAALEHEETLRALMAGVHALPECDHTLLRLLYAEEYLLREIAELLAVTESRVCQIHKRIIEKLRVVTRKNLNGRVNSAGVTSRRQCRSRALPAPAASG
jgi:RNA polymerase sigma factor for flagellar operon FliA